jgi:hypothetical protein
MKQINQKITLKDMQQIHRDAFAKDVFQGVADRDYIAARTLFRNKLFE